MLFVFMDETDVRHAARTKVSAAYAIGTVVVEASDLASVETAWSAAKSVVGLSPTDPVKWNFKDLKKHFERCGLDQAYRHALANMDAFRDAAVWQASRSQVTLLASGVCHVSDRKKREEHLRWAFDALLQRIGRLVQDHAAHEPPATLLVFDRPAQGMWEPLVETYAGAYHFGRAHPTSQAYNCGPLSHLGFFPSVTFATANQVPLIQLADVVAGLSGSFFSWCLGSGRPERAQKWLQPLLTKFHRSAQGQLPRVGLTFWPKDAIDIGQKLTELRRA